MLLKKLLNVSTSLVSSVILCLLIKVKFAPCETPFQKIEGLRISKIHCYSFIHLIFFGQVGKNNPFLNYVRDIKVFLFNIQFFYSSVFSSKNLFRSFVSVIITFLRVLFMKFALFALTNFVFWEHAYLGLIQKPY